MKYTLGSPSLTGCTAKTRSPSEISAGSGAATIWSEFTRAGLNMDPKTRTNRQRPIMRATITVSRVLPLLFIDFLRFVLLLRLFGALASLPDRLVAPVGGGNNHVRHDHEA